VGSVPEGNGASLGQKTTSVLGRSVHNCYNIFRLNTIFLFKKPAIKVFLKHVFNCKIRDVRDVSKKTANV